MEPNQTEIWQVEVAGKIYDAAFDELPEWIAEGSLLPGDKVRKGNLRWAPARSVPRLLPFFNAKERGEPMPVIVTTSKPEPAPAGAVAPEQLNSIATADASQYVVAGSVTPPVITPVSEQVSGNMCRNHAGTEAAFRCGTCQGSYCKACPRSYGGSVRICPDCGELCKPIGGTDLRLSSASAVSSGYAKESFGFADLAAAFRHPLQFRTSLIVGGAMFAALSLGQMVSTLGGMMMMVAAIFCYLLANALSFGVLSHTVDSFARGELDTDFMPPFEDFSILDNVVQPFFLSIAAYLVSFGPFILTGLIGLYLVLGAISSHNDAVMSDLEKIPGTNYYSGRETVEQSQQVKDVLTKISDENAERIDALNDAATGTQAPIVDQDAAEQEALWRSVQEGRKRDLESVIGKTPETRAKENEAIVTGFLNLAAPLVVIGALTFLWGAFLFPAAAAVAGYTRSFSATINPTVALDTIRRLGFDYVRILGMCLVLVFVSAFVGGVVAMVLSPFELPGMGNLPAQGISAFVGFYLYAVFSCVLGYALFKASDRLRLPR